MIENSFYEKNISDYFNICLPVIIIIIIIIIISIIIVNIFICWSTRTYVYNGRFGFRKENILLSFKSQKK